ncbi:uncharacterized protein LOC143175126 isoform X2 [Nomia melanderi]|uniref:uncharacterized protein LOC143175126 isoform X2 n=1 Tax=Nomia melanderi TaxID=2448451 RepID=UPI003FCC5F03
MKEVFVYEREISALNGTENDVYEANNAKDALAKFLSPVNDFNVAITETPKNLLNNSSQATEDNTSKELGTISLDFCDAAVTRGNCTNLSNEASFLIPNTPVKSEESLKTNGLIEIENENIVRNVKVISKVDSLEVIITPLVEREVEDVKLNDYVDALNRNSLSSCIVVGKNENNINGRLGKAKELTQMRVETEKMYEVHGSQRAEIRVQASERQAENRKAYDKNRIEARKYSVNGIVTRKRIRQGPGLKPDFISTLT